MIVVYAETNFVLELAFQQEQHVSCEHLLRLAEHGQIHLVLPAFAMMEGHGTMGSRQAQRNRARAEVRPPMRELRRSAPYQYTAEALSRAVDLLLSQSTKEESARLEDVRRRLLDGAELVPLDAAVLRSAAGLQVRDELSPQDAAIGASVLVHLEKSRPRVSCFLNRNTKDFDKPTLRRDLRRHGCRLIPRFDQGLGCVLSTGEET